MKKKHYTLNKYLFIELLATIALIVLTLFFYFFHIGHRTPIKIGATYMTMNNEFYPILNEQIANKINNKNDLLLSRDPALNQRKQIEEIHSFIQKGVKAIIINPVNGKSSQLNKALKEAKEAGIKIIVVDSPIKNSKYIDCTIESDNYHAGQLDAKYLLSQRKHGKILLLEHKSAISGVERIKGFTDTIHKSKYAKNFKIVKRLNTYGQSETSLPLVTKTIKEGTSFNIIMSLNDRAAIGALAALDSTKYPHRVFVYSVDGSENMKKMFSINPNIKATVAQSPLKMGKVTTKVVYRLIENKKVPKKIIIPVDLINQKNLTQHNISGWQ
ncbi:substrate-binding domain-containing protein [Lactobacillus ultunensis]|nr:substrate-binding domain-containing protein [Lactobacillus ultunensis]